MDKELSDLFNSPSFEYFDRNYRQKYFVDKQDSVLSLEETMLTETEKESWEKCASKLAHFLAKFNVQTAYSIARLTREEKIRLKIDEMINKNRLRNWLNENLANPDDSILSVLPCHIKKRCKEEEEQISKARSVGSNLEEMGASSSPLAPLESEFGLKSKAMKAVNIMSNFSSYCIVAQNLRADVAVWDRKENDVKIINVEDFGLAVVNTPIIQLSLNLADFFILYHEMRRKFYVADVTLARLCNKFAQSFEEELKSIVDTSSLKRDIFWQDVALLTGWEILRRCHTQDNVCFHLNESGGGGGGSSSSDSCVGAALRLLNSSKSADCLGRLTFIGFALC
uniref:Uncharacterized protein n=1 Tax=Romanomermis culicivorax TaxID=13658 RepID=A0A915KMX5_ROMCU